MSSGPSHRSERCTVVVPCYNEEHRLRAAPFLRLASQPGIDLVFVDDGSTDRTAELLAELCRQSDGAARSLRLARNAGKGEAVRYGLNLALERGAPLVAFLDADLATPVEELLRLREVLVTRNADVVLAARVKMLGTHIERRPSRHYLGRVFATAASLSLDMPIYDTQCGAKVFRSTAALRAALARPFLSRWVFDVELLGRLLHGTEGAPPLPRSEILEVPLKTWTHVSGSKVGLRSMAQAAVDLIRFNVDHYRRRH
ncbi:MAG: glycosyltransferase [bacterium]